MVDSSMVSIPCNGTVKISKATTIDGYDSITQEQRQGVLGSQAPRRLTIVSENVPTVKLLQPPDESMSDACPTL